MGTLVAKARAHVKSGIPSNAKHVALTAFILLTFASLTPFRHWGTSKPPLSLEDVLRDIITLSNERQRGMGIGRSAAYAGGPPFYYVTNHPSNDYVSSTVVNYGVFESAITHYIKQRLALAKFKYGEDMLVLDVGANIGCTVTLPIAAEGFNVAAFEMQPSVAKRLDLALRLNNWNGGRVQLFNRAVAADGENVCVAFNQDSAKAGDVGSTTGWVVDSSSTTASSGVNPTDCIRAIRVDDAVGLKRRIPMMKIDVETMEIEVLRSSTKLFEHNLVDEVVAELRPPQKNVFDFLAQYGFNRVQLLHLNGTLEVWSPKEVEYFLSGADSSNSVVNVIFQKH
jgi:FkbM family methyltransferase